MANITIRNLDPQLVERIKLQAKANHRSLQAELHNILNRGISIGSSKDEFLGKADSIAAMTPEVPQTDSAELLREDRTR
jgi:plasmid stability protein